jgi:tetratricopeptide (TPR) repeat protein
VEAGLHLMKFYRDTQSELALSYAYRLLPIFKNASSKLLRAKVALGIGILKEYMQQYDSAVYYLNAVLKLANPQSNKKLIGSAYNSLGVVYEKKANYKRSSEHYMQALKIFEEIGLLQGYVMTCNNLGVVYKNLKNYPLAIAYYSKAMAALKKSGNESELVYLNLGGLYDVMKDFKKALYYLEKARVLARENKNMVILAKTFTNEASIHLEQNDYSKAKLKLKEAEIIAYQSKNNELIISVETLKALIASKGKETDSLAFSMEKTLAMANSLNSDAARIEVLEQMIVLMEKEKNYEKAFNAMSDLMQLKDKVFSAKQTEQMADMQAHYESDKKESAIRILNKENELNESKIKNQNVVLLLLFLVFLIIAFAAVLLYKALSQKKKANVLLEQKNIEIEKQKQAIDNAYETLAEKNKEVLDSIHYAKRIQRALISSEKLMERELNRLMKIK